MMVREPGGRVDVGIAWDPPKYHLNLKRHGLDFGIVTLNFLGDSIIRPAKWEGCRPSAS